MHGLSHPQWLEMSATMSHSKKGAICVKQIINEFSFCSLEKVLLSRRMSNSVLPGYANRSCGKTRLLLFTTALNKCGGSFTTVCCSLDEQNVQQPCL